MQGARLAVPGRYSSADLALGWCLTRPQLLGWILRPGSAVGGVCLRLEPPSLAAAVMLDAAG